MLISQTLRPEDQVRFDTPWYALAPIAGLQISEPAIQIADQHLVRCNRAEWETVERAYIFKDWHSSYYQANPVFVYQPLNQAVTASEIETIQMQLNRDAGRIVTACRLYKTGQLLEPAYTVNFIASDIWKHRAVGPYRSEYLAMPIDGMTWELQSDEVEHLSQIYASLLSVENMSDAEALNSLIAQFNLSFTPVISNFYSIHVLLTAVEMLLGGISRKIDLPSKPYERLQSLARLSYGVELHPTTEVFYNEDIQIVRNAIHHHKLGAINIDLAQVKAHLQIPLMMGIRLLMKAHHLQSEQTMHFYQEMGWLDYLPKDIINACLDRHFLGDVATLQKFLAL